MRKFIALTLTVLLICVCLVGCNDNANPTPTPTPTPSGNTRVYENLSGDTSYTNAPAGTPSVVDNGERFATVAFSYGPVNELNISAIAECGVNTIYVDPWHGANIGTTKMIELLNLCEEYGVDCYISLDNGWETRGNGYKVISGSARYWSSLKRLNGWERAQTYVDQAPIVGYTKDGAPCYYTDTATGDPIPTDYTAYPAFKGFLIFDEPGGKGAGNTNSEDTNDIIFIEREFEYFKSMFQPGNDAFLFYAAAKAGKTYRDYAFLVNFAGTEYTTFTGEDPKWQEGGLFEGHPILFEKITGDGVMICASFDSYPYGFDNNNGVPTFSDSWLYQFEQYRTKVADKYNVPLWGYAQVSDLGAGYRTPDGAQARCLSIYEMRLQAATALAFGASGFQYFPFSSAAEYLGCTDNYGQKTDAFYYVKQLHEELDVFDYLYLDLDWQGTLCAVGSKNKNGYRDDFDILNNLDYSARIKKYSATRDTLIGCFKTSDGFDAYQVVNYNDTYYRKSDVVNITFNNATKAQVYLNGEMTTVDLVNGELVLDLGPGDGALVIPLV